MGHSATPIPLPASSGLLPDVGVPGPSLGGWTMHATGSAPAIVRLWDNATEASGTLLAVIELTGSGNGSFDTEEFHSPVLVTNGIWVEYETGAVEGSIYIV